MADNVAVTPGSGVTLASDDIGGVQYPRVKLGLGADGSATDAPGDGTYGIDVDVTRMAALVAGEAHVGEFGFALTNPTSVLTRVADTNAYAQNDLIASNVTAGSVVVPTVTIARVSAGSVLIPRFRLYTNKTSGWDAVQLRVRLWSTAPTFSNGDNGAYAVATGAAGFLGKVDFVLEQFADGAAAVAAPFVGAAMGIKLSSGQSIAWDLQYIGSASLTPASGQTFTLVPEVSQN